METDKPFLRKKYLALREAAHASATSAHHLAMENNLRLLPAFSSARTILLYASKGSEAPTMELILRLLSQGKRVALPRTQVKEKKIELRLITSLSDLQPSSFGVLEPDTARCPLCSPAEIEFALVPGIAFDLRGQRLGYGLGFYDRFLLLLSCPTAGLAYEAQLAPALPAEKHDVPLHFIVTEKRILDCHPKA